MTKRSTAEIEKDIQTLDEQMRALRAQKLELAGELEEAVAMESAAAKLAKMSDSERAALATLIGAEQGNE